MASGFPFLPFFISNCIKASGTSKLINNVPYFGSMQASCIPCINSHSLPDLYPGGTSCDGTLNFSFSIANASFMVKLDPLLLSITGSSNSFVLIMATTVSLILLIFTSSLFFFNFNFPMTSSAYVDTNFPLADFTLTCAVCKKTLCCFRSVICTPLYHLQLHNLLFSS